MWRSALFLLTVALARGSSAAGHRGDLWAVLVAGSSSWMNYRHQVSLGVWLYVPLSYYEVMGTLL